MDIQYGIKITTEQTTLTDYSIGLVAGVIQWITGRPAIDGWKEGMISKGSFSPVSQEIEIAAGGSYATMSGFSMAARAEVDGAPLWKIIETLGLNLVQKEIILYTFRDGVATQDWTGRIGDYDSDEHEFRIQAMDAFRNIHKPLAKAIDLQAFPNAPKASVGKSIPISIGRISHAKLVNIKTSVGKIACTTVSGVDYKFCAATSYPTSSNYRVVTLKTMDKVFSESELNDMVITVIHGGVSQSRRIVFNSASSGGETEVSIDVNFDISTPFVAWSSGSAADDVWYFEISDNGAVYALSRNPIHSFIKSPDEQNSFNDFVEIYKEETKRFSKILGIDFTKSTTDIESLGYPGMSLKSKYVTSSGSSQVFTALKPTSITLTSKTISGSLTSYVDSLGAVSSSPTDLIDGLYSTGYDFSWTIANTSGWTGNVFGVTYRITIPQDVLEEEMSDIFLLPAYDTEDGGATGHYIYMSVAGVDFYGRNPVPIVADFTLSRDVRNLIWLHENYFSVDPGIETQFSAVGLDTEEDAALGIAKRWQFSLKDIISGAHKLGIYNSYNVTFRVAQIDAIGSATNAIMRFREIGLMSAYDFNFAEKDFYSKIKGELFGGTWGGRKTASNPIENIADCIEGIIRIFDEEESAIDTDAFDLLSDSSTGARKDWFIGRQLTDPKNSFDEIETLARLGFLGIVPKNNGKRAPKAWLDAGAAVATHNSTNIIHGTIGPRTPTSLSRLHNEPEVRYAWNPGSGKFDKLFKITRINESSFPAEADPTWKTYAIGFSDAQYSAASALWSLCHTSYMKYGVIQPLPDNMADGYWFPDVESEWDLTATNNAALLYLTELCNWTPFRKDTISYRLPNTATHAALELLDKVTFNDAFATDGEDVTGWVVRKAIVPGDGQDGKDYIEITLMLAPNIE